MKKNKRHKMMFQKKKRKFFAVNLIAKIDFLITGNLEIRRKKLNLLGLLSSICSKYGKMRNSIRKATQLLGVT